VQRERDPQRIDELRHAIAPRHLQQTVDQLAAELLAALRRLIDWVFTAWGPLRSGLPKN